MYNRLLDSAGIFQIEVSRYMQEPIHKLIRENIMLNNYMKEIMNENLSLNTRYNIKVTNIQNHLLKILKEVHKDTEKRLINFNVLNQYNRENYFIDRDDAQTQTYSSEGHVRELEIMLQIERIKINNSKSIKEKIQCKIKKCRETLYDVKYAILCALKVQ
ncbi:uncharacterized protein LOC122514664 [Polistes fuscatus]|uniref:uncharacterized protein LOC122514664 n=1 Tax=Polistes fuscatus TaxID=30207 RepID=UPI001CA99DCB|nr:uncharacterized protein LOC122514664 [Polistes fuscatus]